MHTFSGKNANISLNNFCYKTHHQNTYTCIHTVFLPAACCHQASHGAARCDIITLRRLVLPPEAPTPCSPSPRCCMSVSQCNLWFRIRLGSNDHNNNGNNNYNNNLLLCVYCSRLVLSSVQSQPRGERERLEKAYITVSIVTCSIVPQACLKKLLNRRTKGNSQTRASWNNTEA